jgi:hypothetical protein
LEFTLDSVGFQLYFQNFGGNYLPADNLSRSQIIKKQRARRLF